MLKIRNFKVGVGTDLLYTRTPANKYRLHYVNGSEFEDVTANTINDSGKEPQLMLNPLEKGHRDGTVTWPHLVSLQWRNVTDTTLNVCSNGALPITEQD